MQMVELYGIIVLGASIGFLYHLLINRKKVSLFFNMISAVVGGLTLGYISIFLGMNIPLIFGSVGTVLFLFMVHLFYYHKHSKS